LKAWVFVVITAAVVVVSALFAVAVVDVDYALQLQAEEEMRCMSYEKSWPGCEAYKPAAE
jgi:hypothetical protein